MPFNPLPSHEGRHRRAAGRDIEISFQSTSLSRGKTAFQMALTEKMLSFNPLPSHEGRHCSVTSRNSAISAFNPLPSHEGRRHDRGAAGYLLPFNPLPSHEGRLPGYQKILSPDVFQSTSLSRGKTQMWDWFALGKIFQSTSLSRGKTRRVRCSEFLKVFQSTSLSRGKTNTSSTSDSTSTFQSTSLSRGKTWQRCRSILTRRPFNPLPSHEGRPHCLRCR